MTTVRVELRVRPPRERISQRSARSPIGPAETRARLETLFGNAHVLGAAAALFIRTTARAQEGESHGARRTGRIKQ